MMHDNVVSTSLVLRSPATFIASSYCLQCKKKYNKHPMNADSGLGMRLVFTTLTAKTGAGEGWERGYSTLASYPGRMGGEKRFSPPTRPGYEANSTPAHLQCSHSRA